MNLRIMTLAVALVSSLALHAAFAQPAQQADYIVAVVNAEPITNSEVRAEVQRVAQGLVQQKRDVPAPQVLRSQVLERLINDRAQLQVAQDTGVRVDPSSIDLAEENAARQSLLSLADFRKRLAKDGVDKERFRAQLRDQLMLARLHERDVESRIRISEVELDRYILEQQSANTAPFEQEINLGQLLIAIPEKTTLSEIHLQAQAQGLLERIREGADFDALVKEFSGAQRDKSGQLGLRRADRYPRSFVLATQNLEVGGVSEIVRSPAGFHILKVLEKRQPKKLIRTVVQTRSRHILLRITPQLTQEAALARLADYKKRIQSGAATFEDLAKKYSQDASAVDGGDLGWATGGLFVPEFEETMNLLTDGHGHISEPVVSRFGVHLIQVLERRRVDLDPQQTREAVRNELRAIRFEEAYTTWAQDIRARAFVDYRDPPQ
jgi:peptidyl-prolyl cis-trans isomerase SurA